VVSSVSIPIAPAAFYVTTLIEVFVIVPALIHSGAVLALD
jgi:hypothetical protein